MRRSSRHADAGYNTFFSRWGVNIPFRVTSKTLGLADRDPQHRRFHPLFPTALPALGVIGALHLEQPALGSVECKPDLSDHRELGGRNLDLLAAGALDDEL